MADAPHADPHSAAHSNAARPNAGSAGGAPDAAASHEAAGYREALESYAELLGVGAEETDSDAVRALERQIADHLVDGAAPTPAPPPED
jgi:hypothetical protein